MSLVFRDGKGRATGLVNTYAGRDAALIGGGPSFAQVDHRSLRNCGAITMTLNNAVVTFKSDLWLAVDPPDRFVRWVWMDPAIRKFTLRKHQFSVIAGAPEARAMDCPNMHFYRQNSWFRCEQMFAPHDPAIWDNRKGSGCRTSFMDSLRVLFLLGIRRIFLFGVDFFQSESYGYHYEKPYDQEALARNNRLYQNLSMRLATLRPLMESAGLAIYNCNVNSRLQVFDFVPPEEAFRLCRGES